MNDEYRTLAGIVPDKPFQSGKVFVPSDVSLGDGVLEWSLSSPKWIAPGTGMLQRFLDLHTADDADILKYARKWGVMGLCKHDLPASHMNVMFGIQYGTKPCEWMIRGHESLTFIESLNVWRMYSSAAAAIVDIAAHLNHGKKPPADLFGRLLFRASLGSSDPRREIELEMSGWLSVGQCGPSFYWQQNLSRWQISLGSNALPNLFGSLALKLMLAVSNTEGMAFCSLCPRSYMVSKRPNPNRNNYCPACRNTSDMWAELKRRQRKRENGGE